MSRHRRQRIRHTEEAGDTPSDEAHPMPWLERGEKWGVIVSTVIALFALGFLIRSVNDARQATVTTQRAWVGVSQRDLTREPGDSHTIHVRVTVVNKGLTPAAQVFVKSRLSIWATPLVDNWDALPNAHPALLFPQALGVGIDKEVPVDAGTAELYRNGQVKIWMTGKITYEDVFGLPHWTTFCAYHTLAQNLQLFALCDTGNDMDRER